MFHFLLHREEMKVIIIGLFFVLAKSIVGWVALLEGTVLGPSSEAAFQGHLLLLVSPAAGWVFLLFMLLLLLFITWCLCLLLRVEGRLGLKWRCWCHS